MNDLRYDHALAAALLCLETIEESPGAAKPQLLGCLVFIILEAMGRYEEEAAKPIEPSAN